VPFRKAPPQPRFGPFFFFAPVSLVPTCLFDLWVLWVCCGFCGCGVGSVGLLGRLRDSICTALTPCKCEPRFLRELNSVLLLVSLLVQGLVYAGKTPDNRDLLYESTGLYGQSTVRRTVLQTGEVLKKRDNDASLFGEGLAMVGGKLIQVTWKTQKVLKFDVPNLKKLGEGTHGMTDGWGLATDASGRLYGSDGTEYLYHLNPKNYSVTKKVAVKDGKQPIVYLNELESVGVSRLGEQCGRPRASPKLIPTQGRSWRGLIWREWCKAFGPTGESGCFKRDRVG